MQTTLKNMVADTRALLLCNEVEAYFRKKSLIQVAFEQAMEDGQDNDKIISMMYDQIKDNRQAMEGIIGKDLVNKIINYKKD